MIEDERPQSKRPRGFRGAIDSLNRAGIEYSLRKAAADAELPMEGELDVWLPPRSVSAADAALSRHGFHHFLAPGQGQHRFYLAFEEGRWLKLDAKLGEADVSARDDVISRMDRLRGGLARRRFVGLRRQGPVVAVLGPDGAGKGTLVAGLQLSIPVAVTTVYLGFGHRRAMAERGGPGGPNGDARSRPSAVRETAFLLRKTLRSWRALFPAYVAAWRGHIVLCDRHPAEVLATRPDRGKTARVIERFIASHLVPRPDAVILLDAPGEVLFRRKNEHSVEVLDRWRQSYAEVFVPLGATIVSTAGPPGAALAQASEVVWRALKRRRAW